MKFVLLVILLAVAIYWVVKLLGEHRDRSAGPPPVGPDDDPDFLRRLDGDR